MKGVKFARLAWASEHAELSENVLTHIAAKRGWELREVEGTQLIDTRVMTLPRLKSVTCDPEPQPEPEPDFGADGWPNWIA